MRRGLSASDGGSESLDDFAAVYNDTYRKHGAKETYKKPTHTLDEIAELTDVGVETVKSRLRYAMNKLRSNLSDLYEAQR